MDMILTDNKKHNKLLNQGIYILLLIAIVTLVYGVFTCQCLETCSYIDMESGIRYDNLNCSYVGDLINRDRRIIGGQGRVIFDITNWSTEAEI